MVQKFKVMHLRLHPGSGITRPAVRSRCREGETPSNIYHSTFITFFDPLNSTKGDTIILLTRWLNRVMMS